MTTTTIFDNISTKNVDADNEKNELSLVKNSALGRTMNALKKSKEELKELNGYIKKWCDFSGNKSSISAKLLSRVLPQKIYSAMPSGFLKFIAEESDILEMIEQLMKKNVNNTQESLRDLAVCAFEKRQMLDGLENDIKIARAENWNSQKLQQYMAEKAGVVIYEEVARLLGAELNALPLEEKERRKIEILEQLCSNIKVGEQLMATISSVCVAGLEVFHRGISQYYNYVNFYKPVAVMRDAAKTLVDMDQSMYAGKEALTKTFKTSLDAIEVAIDAANMIEKYSIASTDMSQLLESGRKRLNDKMKALNAFRANKQKVACLPEMEV